MSSRRRHADPVEVITLDDESYEEEENQTSSGGSAGQSVNQTSNLLLADLCYKCCLCEKPYSTENDLEAHLTTDHLKWVPYKCDYCSYVWLPTEHALRAHLNLQHPKEPPKVSLI